MVVRRVFHKPAPALFDVYLERVGRWEDPTLENEPDFFALVPMAGAVQVAASLGIFTSHITALERVTFR